MRRAEDDVGMPPALLLRGDVPAGLAEGVEQVLAGLRCKIEGRRSGVLAGDAIGAPVGMRMRAVACELDQEAHAFGLTWRDA